MYVSIHLTLLMMWLTFCYMFKPPHYILITGVVICFVLDSLYYLFHTSSLSLCILFYFVIARNEKKKLYRELIHMLCTNLKILYAQSFLLSPNCLQICVQIQKSICTVIFVSVIQLGILSSAVTAVLKFTNLICTVIFTSVT